LDHFADYYPRPTKPSAVQQVFRPLAAIADAFQRRSVVEGWAVLLPDDPRVLGNERDRPLAFSVDEAALAFGGVAGARAACGACPANVSRTTQSPVPESSPVELAGCSQVLLMGTMQRFSRQTRELRGRAKPLPLPDGYWAYDEAGDQGPSRIAEALFAAGQLRQLLSVESPRLLWQRFWYLGAAGGALTPERMVAFLEDVQQSKLAGRPEDDSPEPLTGWFAFCAAVQRAVERGLSLELEYWPRGYADGHAWWLGPHCGNCGAGLEPTARQCNVCGHGGGPVPAHKRRIMGWAPYRPLESLLKPAAAAAVLAAATGQRPDND
jgi:hypothetical protein